METIFERDLRKFYNVSTMNKLLLGAMNNNKRYNRPFQLQVNVPRTIGILRDVSEATSF